MYHLFNMHGSSGAEFVFSSESFEEATEAIPKYVGSRALDAEDSYAIMKKGRIVEWFGGYKPWWAKDIEAPEHYGCHLRPDVPWSKLLGDHPKWHQQSLGGRLFVYSDDWRRCLGYLESQSATACGRRESTRIVGEFYFPPEWYFPERLRGNDIPAIEKFFGRKMQRAGDDYPYPTSEYIEGSELLLLEADKIRQMQPK
jgi:hypothetical protein